MISSQLFKLQVNIKSFLISYVTLTHILNLKTTSAASYVILYYTSEGGGGLWFMFTHFQAEVSYRTIHAGQ